MAGGGFAALQEQYHIALSATVGTVIGMTWINILLSPRILDSHRLLFLLQHKPIAWQAPDAAPAGSKEPIQRSTTAERQEEKPHDDPRRTASDPVMATRAKVADTKHEQREGRRVEEDKRRTQADEEAKRAQRNGHHDESDQKHAQRDGHRAEPEGKRAQRDPEAKHAQRDSHHEHDLERAKRAGVRDRNVLLPHDSRRPRGTDDSTVRWTADRTRNNSSSRYAVSSHHMGTQLMPHVLEFCTAHTFSAARVKVR